MALGAATLSGGKGGSIDQYALAGGDGSVNDHAKPELRTVFNFARHPLPSVLFSFDPKLNPFLVVPDLSL